MSESVSNVIVEKIPELNVSKVSTIISNIDTVDVNAVNKPYVYAYSNSEAGVGLCDGSYVISFSYPYRYVKNPSVLQSIDDSGRLYVVNTIKNTQKDEDNGKENINIVKLQEVNATQFLYSLDEPAYFYIKPELRRTNLFPSSYLTYSYLTTGIIEDIEYYYAVQNSSYNKVTFEEASSAVDKTHYVISYTSVENISGYIKVSNNGKQENVQNYYEEEFVLFDEEKQKEYSGPVYGVTKETVGSEDNIVDVYNEIILENKDVEGINIYIPHYKYNKIENHEDIHTYDFSYNIFINCNDKYVYAEDLPILGKSGAFYSYTYIACDKDSVIEEDTKYFIKQRFRPIVDEAEFNSLREAGITIYVNDNGESHIKENKVSLTQTLDDINYNANVLYSKLSYNEGESQYYSLTALREAAAEQTSKADQNISTYMQGNRLMLKNIDEYKLSNITEKYVSLDGIYKEYTGGYTDYIELYVEGDGFYEIGRSYVVFDSNTTFYKYELNRIEDNTQIDLISFTYNGNPVYVEVPEDIYNAVVTREILGDKFLCMVDSYGYINGANYYYAEHQYKLSDDVFMSRNKNYYVYRTSNTNYVQHIKEKFIDYEHVSSNNNISVFKITGNGSYSLVKADSYTLAGAPDDAKEYIRTKYIYPSLTINTGIANTWAGSYCITAQVFDKSHGQTSRSLIVNQHINVLSALLYTDTAIEYVPVIYKEQIIDDNSLYYIRNTSGNYVKLSDIQLSAKILFENGVSLFTKKETSVPRYYNASKHQYGENGKPVAIEINGTKYGLVSTSQQLNNLHKGDSKLTISEVKKFDKHISNSKIQKLQDHLSTAYAVQKPTPFALVNDCTYISNGTYTWVNAGSKTVAYQVSKDNQVLLTYETYAGYWKKNYDVEKIPFIVDANVRYTNDSISSTYSFIPNSYMVKAVVHYPEISYTAIVPYSRYTEFYTYINNLGEHLIYTDKVIDEDGSYYGVVDGKKVELYKDGTVKEGTTINNITIQNEKSETQYFTYRTAFELTNEKAPVLYETKLNPAVIKQITLWDTEIGSYVTKNVVESYAYYSYEYIYETKPLLTSSYIAQLNDINETLTYSAYNISHAFANQGGAIDNNIQKGFDKQNELLRDISNNVKQGLSDISNMVSETTRTFFENNAILPKTNIVESNPTETKTLGRGTRGEGSVDTSLGTTSVSGTTSSVSVNANITNASVITNSIIDAINDSADVIENVGNSIEDLSTDVRDELNKLSTTSTETLAKTNDAIEHGFNNVRNAILPGDIKHVTKLNLKTAQEEATNLQSLGSLLDTAFIHTKQEYVEEDNVPYLKTSYIGIADILYNISGGDGGVGIPNKGQFICDVSAQLFTAVDFDSEITDFTESDENGNIINKITHKNNPYEVAKKSVMRASILWNEIAMQGFVKDPEVTAKIKTLRAYADAQIKIMEKQRELVKQKEEAQKEKEQQQNAQAQEDKNNALNF